MLGRRHLPGTQEASGNGEPMSRHGLLTWWQHRSRRMDLEVLARVREGLNRLDTEPDGAGSVSPPPAGTADERASAPPAADAETGTEAPAPAAAPAQETAADLLPDSAIVSIRETFAIVAAAGEKPASYFYGRLFAGHPHLRNMFPPAMDVQRDRLLRALIQIVEGLTSPEDLVRYLSQLGRDQLVRVLYGARISLLVATSATAVALVIGVSLGLLAGYLGGWVDAIVTRMTETAMAFPNVLLGVGLAIVIGPGLLNVVIIISLFTWYYPARIVRGTTVGTKKMTFVAAARALGARPRRLLLVHLLPQVWGPLLVYATSIIANNIIFEAGLSYLGVGVPPPTPSWGSMLSDAVTSGMYQTDIGLALVPGLALVITMLAFNLLGDGIRDALDPKGRR